ncbi:MBL fold metallo-hydrolase [Methanomassiliicoccus luminyensis]|uniref:MBL fold metallo-hydrolase n=1 Tax=Methanomassiliicoccus luminyensis TaxID=1080712 RepID=UPI0003647ACE|nr:MBL fold metallo-hydrolase [Methanomassiliicoccus luminyensis]
MALTIKHLSRSCFQLRTPDRCVYFDPGPLGRGLGLPKADLILVTHHHWDHVLRGTVARLTGADTLAVGTEKSRRKLGPRRIIINPGESVDVKGIAINAVHAYNSSGSRRITYHRKGAGVGYVISMGGKTIYHAGDTGLIEEMSSLGGIDIAFLPIGGKFTMDIGEAAEAVERIRPRIVVPMHMLKADPLEFKELVEKRAPTTAVRVLRPGEEMALE